MSFTRRRFLIKSGLTIAALGSGFKSVLAQQPATVSNLGIRQMMLAYHFAATVMTNLRLPLGPPLRLTPAIASRRH